MKVLHLFSNAKWTGPAEPALNLCLALRGIGVDADFACSPNAGNSENKVVATARARGLEPILAFRLHKHHHPLLNWRDSSALLAYLRKNRYDVIHCHLHNDHRIARGPARKLGLPIVRSSYEGLGMPSRHGGLLSSAERVIEPSQRALEHDVQTYGLAREACTVIPNAVDTTRFDPQRAAPSLRARLNIPGDAFLLGIVARMQRHRRFEMLFEAMQQLAEAAPNLHLALVGRGTYQESVAFQPARALDLSGRVHFTGYLDGDDFVGALQDFDASLLLVPGSDGTCRAVREAMAMGTPAIVSDSGMLSEIVTHGHDGLVFGNDAAGLSDAIARLYSDRELTKRLGANARATAVSRYSLDVQARAVLEVYKSITPAGATGFEL